MAIFNSFLYAYQAGYVVLFAFLKRLFDLRVVTCVLCRLGTVDQTDGQGDVFLQFGGFVSRILP